MWSRARPKGGLGTGGSARCHMLLLVLVPIGSYREVGETPLAGLGRHPKGWLNQGTPRLLSSACCKSERHPRYRAQTTCGSCSPAL